jgi:hypothetical protein
MNDTRYDKKARKRFWSKVSNTNQKGCWIWQGTVKGKMGYGGFYYRGKNISAHRYAYYLKTKKTIPKNMCVLHKCDNPRCVNPNHLWLGTNDDNVRDRDKKLRSHHHREFKELSLIQRNIIGYLDEIFEIKPDVLARALNLKPASVKLAIEYRATMSK